MSDPNQVNPGEPADLDPSGATVGGGQPEGDSVQGTDPDLNPDPDGVEGDDQKDGNPEVNDG